MPVWMDFGVKFGLTMKYSTMSEKTLAYYTNEKITDVKSFIVLAQKQFFHTCKFHLESAWNFFFSKARNLSVAI